ncbi:MAG TPA: hypothetical protein VLZ83_08320 [Edaphocola sp.]|nr:hypothetical protein [Edaphocola sp.]
MRFSERYGYVKPSDVIIREWISTEIQNAICTCYDELNNRIYSNNGYTYLEWHLWCNFLNKRKNDFGSLQRYRIVATEYIEKSKNPWYKKLDLIETTIKYLNDKYDSSYENVTQSFINTLNNEFERLNFGYRIIDGLVTEITSELEIQTIEKALEDNKDNVRIHLNNALKALSIRPTGDYRNSIKESISAVEALNKEITGKNTWNLNKMIHKALPIAPALLSAFNILYGYTNNDETGIRHALMGENSDYVPGADEALYMLITCSAFINYLNSKLKPENKQQ